MAFVGEALVTKIMEKVIDVGFNYLADQWHSGGMKDELQRLKVALPRIQAVVAAADNAWTLEQQTANPHLQEWLQQFKDALYEADDVLDELEYFQLQKQVKADDDRDEDHNKKQVEGDTSLDELPRKVPSEKTLITPVQCKSLWRQFNSETEYTVTQAIAAQEANKRNNNWLPPPWAMAAILVLGFNEFMTLLRNPLYLFVIFVTYLLGKALWVQLDISGEFRNGALPGILSLSTKFLPTVMNLLKKLADEGQVAAAPETRRNHELDSRSFMNGVNSDTTSDASSNVTSSESGTEYTSPMKQ